MNPMTGPVNFAKKAYSVELREIPVPEIGEEEVLLAVKAVGICATPRSTLKPAASRALASNAEDCVSW